jgi:hypothetical protein
MKLPSEHINANDDYVRLLMISTTQIEAAMIIRYVDWQRKLIKALIHPTVRTFVIIPYVQSSISYIALHMTCPYWQVTFTILQKRHTIYHTENAMTRYVNRHSRSNVCNIKCLVYSTEGAIMTLSLKNVYYNWYGGKVTTGIKDDWLVTV